MKILVNSSAPGLTLTGVTVRRQFNQVTVLLRGHGLFRYQAVLVDVHQLALDFPKSISSLSFNMLPVRHRLLKEIRIAQYPKKLRLMFEVTPHTRYAVKIGTSVLAIQFRL